MYNHKFISIKRVADNIKRGKLYKDIPFESVLSYAADALKLIMAEKYFLTKPARLEIKNHKAAMPCDFEFMIQCTKYDCVKDTFTPMRYGTDNFHSVYHVTGSGDIQVVDTNPTQYEEYEYDKSTDVSDPNSRIMKGSHEPMEYTYAINNDIIQTSFKEGELFFVYKAIHTDQDGMLLIPDNVNVLSAVEYYIKYRYLDDIASDEPAIERRRDKDEQMYCWYVGKAQSAATNMTMDEQEAFGNSMSQLFTNPAQFKDRMKALGMQEYLKLQ